MSLEIQFNLKKNPNYLLYLRSHSYWYKILTRSPNKYKDFENEVKKYYKLTKVDKLEKTLNTFEMLEKLLSVIK